MKEFCPDTIKIHCSSLGSLFTEPKLKVDKEAGNLSETAKTHLIKVYIKHYWGRERRIETKQMKKGTVNEIDGIALLSSVDGVTYTKNTETRENEYIIGTCDIVVEDTVDDNKNSWDAESFLCQLTKPLDKDYEYQNRGYMWLWDKPKSRTRYTLVDADDMIIEDEKRRLLYSMGVATDENPEYKYEAAKLEYNMRFGDIPKTERVIDKWVYRDKAIEIQIVDKVLKARQFLKEFHELHTKRKS